ncbi:hypothetical protein Dda_7442 [Drechslerella dactyloides]|uniref:Uncharacterized protein n=1 Tax=Drechslerella dactyloides TaxID=74499 RepID=A0AAD6IU11_DREDA|nr:hypothetical protein Dda_7442 [Drechslerella dactyloides]
MTRISLFQPNEHDELSSDYLSSHKQESTKPTSSFSPQELPIELPVGPYEQGDNEVNAQVSKATEKMTERIKEGFTTFVEKVGSAFKDLKAPPEEPPQNKHDDAEVVHSESSEKTLAPEGSTAGGDDSEKSDNWSIETFIKDQGSLVIESATMAVTQWSEKIIEIAKEQDRKLNADADADPHASEYEDKGPEPNSFFDRLKEAIKLVWNTLGSAFQFLKEKTISFVNVTWEFISDGLETFKSHVQWITQNIKRTMFGVGWKHKSF